MRCHGQMSTLRLETVLIGNIVDGVGHTIIANETVTALNGNSLLLCANIVKFTLCFLFVSIRCFETAT